MSNLLAARPEWLTLLEPDALKHPRRKQGLENELGGLLKAPFENQDYPTALRLVRQFKQREMLRLAARDLSGFGTMPEITQEISNVADVCLDAVWRVCWRQLVEHHGQPHHQDASGVWRPTAGCVLGMGKLGGQELNYSSDVDRPLRL